MKWLLLSVKYPSHFTWGCVILLLLPYSLFMVCLLFLFWKTSILETCSSEKALCCNLTYLDILKSAEKNGELSFHPRIFIVNRKIKILAVLNAQRKSISRTPECMQIKLSSEGLKRYSWSMHNSTCREATKTTMEKIGSDSKVSLLLW